MTNISFQGRVAVVTGAGNGLGRAYALELARRGARVVVNDLGVTGSGEGVAASAADKVVDEIRSAGGTAVANHASVATREGGTSIVAAALDAWGRIDIVINNAGFLRNNRFEDLSDTQIDSMIDVHLRGAFYVSQPAFREMKKRGYGRILFTGSTSGMFGHAWQANYGAAKAAMLGLSNVVALEGADYGIHANVLLPTAMTRLANEMHDGFLEIPSFAANAKAADWPPPERCGVEFNVPLALYLVSEPCTATHGVFCCNGGRYARVGICAAEGWVAPAGAAPPSLEELAGHFEQVSDLRGYTEPQTVYDEASAATAAGRRQGVFTGDRRPTPIGVNGETDKVSAS